MLMSMSSRPMPSSVSADEPCEPPALASTSAFDRMLDARRLLDRDVRSDFAGLTGLLCMKPSSRGVKSYCRARSYSVSLGLMIRD
jgi:hypothetical protein